MTRRPGPRSCLLFLGSVLAALAGLLSVPGTAAAAPAASGAAAAGHVVFVGLPGLMWSDVTAGGTPHLAALSGHASSAALSVRTVEKTTCPTDGWLTVGAGARSTDKRPGGACGPLPAPAVGADGVLTVPALPGIADFNDKYSYDAQFGAAAAAVARAGKCVTAVGPGAALATADAQGRSPARYRPDTAGLDAAALAECALTLIDLGPVADAAAPIAPDGTGDRAARLRAFDAELGRIAAALPPRTELIVAGVADDGTTPHLRTMLAGGPDAAFDSGLLTSSSTRFAGMVQLTDVAPSLLAPLGIAIPDGLVGSVVEPYDGPRDNPTGLAAARHLELLDVGAQAARTVREKYQFFTWLTLLPALVLVGGATWVRRQGRTGEQGARRRRVLRVMQGVAVAAAVVPASSFLVGLFPWEKAPSPEWAIIGITLGFAALFTAVAMLLSGRQRDPYLGTDLAATLTVVVLGADVILGSTLQMNALFGLSPLIAGRFYGFGNVAWSIYGMAVLLAVAPRVGRRLEAGKRRAAIGLLGVLALAAIVVNGWPAFGSDFGGVLALVPGFAVLGMMLTGTRISWAKAGLVALAAVGAVAVISVLDWMRPAASRSHLGKFVQDVVDGEAGTVLQRKIADNLGSFGTPVSFLVPVLFVLMIIAILNPPKLRATALVPAYERVSWLRPVLVAMWVTAVVGYAANDSGIQIPSVALLIALPLSCAVLCAVAAEEPPGSAVPAGGGIPPRPLPEPQGAE
ncbi:hypothetical protein [Yinghuangia soli]|uniref:Uncharacterized protein n=1 Tax=Yinghuangia soli TaxID=2908204 RepID=A0AA41PVH4_9ACTN|nr:hypothetical protein [Yinghuangia soli]MCF2526466.1 hypothetical protein [Yinghuangia soli]